MTLNPPQIHAIFINGKRYVREDSIGIPVVLGPGPDDAAIARIVPAAAAQPNVTVESFTLPSAAGSASVEPPEDTSIPEDLARFYRAEVASSEFQARLQEMRADLTRQFYEPLPLEDLEEIPTFDRDQLPDSTDWQTYRKIPLTRALRISGPFRVRTSESENEPFLCQDGYLAIDSRGYPYAIAADEFEQIYKVAQDRAEEQLRPDCRQEDPDACPFGQSCSKDWWHHSKSLDWVRSFLANAGVLELVHCDDLVLHEPGECTYCDSYGKRAQRRRIDFGIPFSGQRGAPDALFRPDEVIRQWSGNVPVKGEVHSHLGATFVVE